MRYLMVSKKMNPLFVWGWDRKIRLEDYRLGSRGLPSGDKSWSQGTEFSTLTLMMDSFNSYLAVKSMYILNK